MTTPTKPGNVSRSGFERRSDNREGFAEIMRLMSTLRALSFALLALFVVLGVCGSIMFGYLLDTRTATRNLAEQQRSVICDSYHRNQIPPPKDLDCR